MQIKLKSINLTNYKGQGTHSFTANFGNVTKISGRNRSGKSSVLDSYMETLTGKLADGSEPNSVRPHDENGNDLNRDDVVRELVFDIDGTETSVKKVTSQKWVKKRGATEEVFEGNKTTYVIDGFESSNQKAFTEWREKIAKVDVLLMCSNARPFLNTVQKSTAEARKILESLAGFSTEKFIAENPKYANIAEITKNHKIEDVLKQLRRDLTAQKKVASDAKVKLDYERAREISAGGGIEIAELELAINGLKEKISELDKQESILDEAVKAYDEASNGVLELKFELNDLTRKANEENNRKRREIYDKIDEKKFLVMKTETTIRNTESSIDYANRNISNLKEQLEESRENWKAENERVFDDSSLVCPYCEQEYPTDKKEQKRAEFESHKAEELKKITAMGNKTKEDLDKEKETLSRLKEEMLEHRKSLEMLDNAIADLEKQLSELPQSIDISDTEEYKTLQSQIAEKETALNATDNNKEKRAEIKSERQRLLEEISEKKALILKYQADVEQKENNVSMLEADLREKNQAVADVEMKIDTLRDFSIEKNQQLAKEINPFFRHFQFEFLAYTQEQNPIETLRIVCNGTDYFSGLNLSDRILCEIDLVCGLQALNNLNLPVFADNTESINADRLNDFIKDLPQQIILLGKTDDPQLKVEILK